MLAADHQLAGRRVLWLREVLDEPMIMLDMGPSEQYYTTMLRSVGITPAVRHRTASFESVRSLVARGIGWSLLIQRPAIDLSYEALPLATAEIRDDIEEVDVVLAVPAGMRLTRRTRAFVDFCLDACRSRPVQGAG
ncbi:LysR substrate-binding domain-containing protein [Streptomyces sp. UG1]|uniref:LysR substrate-binding domain-containing protein n=1 Tax=Streptomyces sp. UG1 TaxID=3417652 RepID=UPI003CEB06E9